MIHIGDGWQGRNCIIYWADVCICVNVCKPMYMYVCMIGSLCRFRRTGCRFAAMVAPLASSVPTCDSAHSWQLYSTTSLEHQATSTMTYYPIQSHYSETE